jgi:hypothetical protein
MASPVRSEVHLYGTGASAAAETTTTYQDQKLAASGVTAPLSKTSVIQTVYYCQKTDAVLAVVVLDPATRTVRTAQTDDATPVLGIITSKPSETTAVVVSFGPVDGFADLQMGARYYLGPNGSLWTPPLLDSALMYVHPVGLAVTDSQIFVMPSWPKVKRIYDDGSEQNDGS